MLREEGSQLLRDRLLVVPAQESLSHRAQPTFGLRRRFARRGRGLRRILADQVGDRAGGAGTGRVGAVPRRGRSRGGERPAGDGRPGAALAGSGSRAGGDGAGTGENEKGD